MAIQRLLRRRATKIALVSALFIGFIVEFVTREPSFDPEYLLHSWTGIVLIPVLGFHLGGNWGWINRLLSNRGRDREARLGLFNAVFGVLTTICIVTGFPLWFGWVEGGAMAGVHTATGMLAILAMFVHLIWNRKRIVGLVRSPARSRAAARA